MIGSTKLIVIGLIVAALAVAGGVFGIAYAHNGSVRTTALAPATTVGGYGSMMGGADGSMMGGTYGGMMGGGYGPTSRSAQSPIKGAPTVTLLVKADVEHGKLGPDGKWHDAFLPANFSVQAGKAVNVTVYNYDTMPHSFSSSSLGLNVTIPSGSLTSPSKVTFAFTAPTQAGSYQWWCALPCDPFSMAHNGFMRGQVRVAR